MILSKLLVIASAIIQMHCGCIFLDDCPNASNCPPKPFPQDGAYTNWVNYNGTFPCPEYQLEQTCCNDNQIDATFGSANGGCDICASNLKQFWCYFTCSPDQDIFMSFDGYGTFVESGFPLPIVAANISIRVEGQTACEMWNSCKLTPFAAQVSAMQSPAGFLAFQGENAVSQASQYITTNFTADGDPKSIAIDNMQACDATFSVFGFTLAANCSCNNCDLACPVNDYVPPKALEGLQVVPIVIIFCIGLALTLAVVLINRHRLKKRIYDRDAREQEEQYQQVRS